MLTLLVALRVLANPLANVFQKQLTQRNADPLFITTATYAALSLACLPFLALFHLPDLSTAFWLNMGACATLAVLGNVLLVQALQREGLSVLGPINAYKAVVGLLAGALLLGELPTTTGLLGVGLIIAGSYVVLSRPKQTAGNVVNRLAVRLRVAALLCSAVDGVFLKRAILLSSPEAGFFGWAVLGFGLTAVWLVITSRGRLRTQLATLFRWPATYLALFASVGLMVLSTNWVLARMSVGYALALFQLSALVSVAFGYGFFRETDIPRKLIGATIMVAGAVLITVY